MLKVFQQAKGSNALIGIGEEATYNTAPSSGFALKFNSSSVSAQRDLNESGTIMSGRSPAEPFQGNGSVDGEIVVPNDVLQMSRLLKLAFGAPDTTALGSGKYQHVFKIYDTQPSFSFEQVHKDIGEIFLYTGCKFSTMKVAAAADGQENTVSFGLMGSKPITREPVQITQVQASADTRIATVTFDVSSFPSLQAGDKVIVSGTGIKGVDGLQTVETVESSHITFHNDEIDQTTSYSYTDNYPVINAVKIATAANGGIKRLGTFFATLYKDGAEYRAAKNFSFDFDFGLDGEQRCIGDNGFRSEIPEGKVTIGGSLTALFKSGELFRAAQSATTIGFKLTFAIPDSVEKFEINVPEMKVQPATPAVDTAGGLSQDLNIQGFASVEGASAVTITIVNELETL